MENVENVENKKLTIIGICHHVGVVFSNIQWSNEHVLQKCVTLYKTFILRIKEQLKLFKNGFYFK